MAGDRRQRQRAGGRRPGAARGSLVTMTTVPSAAVLISALIVSQMPVGAEHPLDAGERVELLQRRLHRLGRHRDAALRRRRDGADHHHARRAMGSSVVRNADSAWPISAGQRRGLRVLGHRADLHEQLLHGVERPARPASAAGRSPPRRRARSRAPGSAGSALPCAPSSGAGESASRSSHHPGRPWPRLTAALEREHRRGWRAASARRAPVGSSGKVRPSIARVSMIFTGKPSWKMLSAGRGLAEQGERDVGQQQDGDHRAGDLQRGQEHHRERLDHHRGQLVGRHVRRRRAARRRRSRSP